MNSLFVLRALLFAAECLAASVLILGAAWLGSTTLKRASLRHLVWLGAFGALLVLPVAALIVPSSIVLERTAAAPRPLPSFVEPAAAAADPAPIPSEAATRAPPPAASWQPDMKDVATLLFAVWLAGALWAVLRLALGTLGLAALRRQSRPHALASADMPRAEGPRIEGRRECELRLSNAQDGPMTWGVLRPVILLPKEALAWPRERLQAVLLHELAHVRRRDSLTQSLALVASALYWPNPLVWWAARALRREAEIAADDAAIVSGIRPSAYAGELVKLASQFRGRPLAFSGVSMAGSALEARVKSALAPNRSRTGVTSMDAFKIAFFGIAATAALALARPDIVQAQDAAVPPAPPAPVAAPTELPPPPPVPAAPEAVPAPPAPPTPPTMVTNADDDEDATPADRVVKVREVRHGHNRTIERTEHVIHIDRAGPADQAAMERDEAEMRKAQMQLDKIGPEVDRAIAAAKIDEKVAEAMRDVEPRIRAEVARAMAKARPEIRKAIADAHISEKVARAVAEAMPQIDVAIAKAHQGHGRIVIRHDDEATGKDDEDDQEQQ
jgi:beta-lactamase regulating signal transducer with metallopeptidase domain